LQLWDLRRELSIAEGERCLQTFTTMDFQLTRVCMVPRQVVTLPCSTDAVIIVAPRLKAFQLKRMLDDSKAPTAVIYNSEFSSLYVATDGDLKVCV
jgi:hypothetical protein